MSNRINIFSYIYAVWWTRFWYTDGKHPIFTIFTNIPPPIYVNRLSETITRVRNDLWLFKMSQIFYIQSTIVGIPLLVINSMGVPVKIEYLGPICDLTNHMTSNISDTFIGFYKINYIRQHKIKSVKYLEDKVIASKNITICKKLAKKRFLT